MSKEIQFKEEKRKVIGRRVKGDTRRTQDSEELGTRK